MEKEGSSVSCWPQIDSRFYAEADPKLVQTLEELESQLQDAQSAAISRCSMMITSCFIHSKAL